MTRSFIWKIFVLNSGTYFFFWKQNSDLEVFAHSYTFFGNSFSKYLDKHPNIIYDP